VSQTFLHKTSELGPPPPLPKKKRAGAVAWAGPPGPTTSRRRGPRVRTRRPPAAGAPTYPQTQPGGGGRLRAAAGRWRRCSSRSAARAASLGTANARARTCSAARSERGYSICQRAGPTSGGHRALSGWRPRGHRLRAGMSANRAPLRPFACTPDVNRDREWCTGWRDDAKEGNQKAFRETRNTQGESQEKRGNTPRKNTTSRLVHVRDLTLTNFCFQMPSNANNHHRVKTITICCNFIFLEAARNQGGEGTSGPLGRGVGGGPGGRRPPSARRSGSGAFRTAATGLPWRSSISCNVHPASGGGRVCKPRRLVGRALTCVIRTSTR